MIKTPSKLGAEDELGSGHHLAAFCLDLVDDVGICQAGCLFLIQGYFQQTKEIEHDANGCGIYESKQFLHVSVAKSILKGTYLCVDSLLYPSKEFCALRGSLHRLMAAKVTR